MLATTVYFASDSNGFRTLEECLKHEQCLELARYLEVEYLGPGRIDYLQFAEILKLTKILLNRYDLIERSDYTPNKEVR